MPFRLATVAGRATLLTDDPFAGIDVATASGGAVGPDPLDALARADRLSELASAPADVPVDPDALEAPVPRPGQVFGIGLNYRGHAEESGMAIPEQPLVFTKFPTCITGPAATVALPSGAVDWEVELVAVVGRGGRDLDEQAAAGALAGYTVGQDLSERAVQFASSPAQFNLGKSYAGFGPTGPAVVSLDSLDDPDDLALWCEVDGERVQAGRTGDLIFGVPTLVAYLSSIVELRPGDLIFTGTPDGVGFTRTPPRFLAAGQTIVSTIEGVGTITTRLTA